MEMLIVKSLKGHLVNIDQKGKAEYYFPKAQPHILRRIKERLVYENKQIVKRRFIAFIAISITLIAILIYILQCN